MAYIYKITNLLNEKCYIGKTEKTNPQQRYQEHLRDRFRYPERPLYRAINKYGEGNFTFEVIEESLIPEEREVYWIQFYNSYGSTGYNATLGGDGKKYIEEEEIILLYQTMNAKEIHQKLGYDEGTIRSILRRNNIEVRKASFYRKKAVNMLNQDGELLRSFESLTEAGTWFVENLNVTTSGSRKVARRIGEVACGNRKTAYGYRWEYLK